MAQLSIPECVFIAKNYQNGKCFHGTAKKCCKHFERNLRSAKITKPLKRNLDSLCQDKLTGVLFTIVVLDQKKTLLQIAKSRECQFENENVQRKSALKDQD